MPTSNARSWDFDKNVLTKVVHNRNCPCVLIKSSKMLVELAKKCPPSLHEERTPAAAAEVPYVFL